MHRFIAMAVFLVAFALPSTASAATQTLTVEKIGTGTGTVTSSPAGIDCGATCSAPFAEGATVTLKGVAGTNTAAVVWTGCAQVNLENECLVKMSAAKTVKATFNLLKRTLKVTKNGTGTGTVTSSPSGIECGATCSASFDHGTTVTLTGAPGANSQAPTWTGCESVNEGKCVVTMTAAKSVTATFSIPTHQLTVTKNGSGSGTVTSSPSGINCGATCSASYDKGTKVTLTAAMGPHTLSVTWTGCENVIEKVKCLVAMNAAHAVTASFELDPLYVEYTVTVRKKGTGFGTVTSSPGGIDCGEDCSETYVNKTRLTLIATPAAGSAFDYWSGGGCAGTGPCEATIKSSRLVTAHFVSVGTRTLTVSKTGTGAGTVSSNTGAIECGATCSAQIDASSTITLIATAAAGSTFTGWSGACSGTAAKCKLLMNEARNVTASFTKLPLGSSVPSVAGNARVKGGKARLRLSCSGQSLCQGTLKLLLRVKNAQGQTKGLVVASSSYSLAAGSSQVLSVKLSRRALQALKSTGRLVARVVGAGESHAVRLTA